ncbi:hypothetical protein RJ639_026748 [Escallonia herrerae]|uniref:Uncharacterized protein n=1 Tax=Escallonia herrerae TaxID=1293975 RepID=A0AA88XBG5_9ASTE|nr:hypothetical protein RJ639_026748 [Escallonia herrerae]
MARRWCGTALTSQAAARVGILNQIRSKGITTPESSNVIIPIWETYSIPCSSCICGLGSTIYSLGSHPRGSSKFSRHTRYGDVACPEKGWMLGPPMRSRRLLFGQAVPLEGKIYMFGGVRKVSSKKPWGEVLDPKKNEWRALAAPPANFPPTDLYHEDLYALALGKDRIVLGSRHSGGLFTYTPSSDSWEVVDQDFDKMRCYSTPVMVRSTMYWFDHRKVYAYNFDLNRMCSGRINCPIIEESPVNCFSRQIYIPPLIYLGDSMFCYIWPDANGGRDRSPYSRLVCAKLDIESDFGGGGRGHVKATEVSIEAHPLDRLLSRQDFDAITLSTMKSKLKAEAFHGRQWRSCGHRS